MSSFERRNFSDELNIETPEQVELAYSVAGIGSRFVALLLDGLILGGIYVVAIVVLVLIFSGMAGLSDKFGGLKGSGLNTAAKWVLAFFILLNFLLIWGYFALFEAFWHGQTPGKRAMKLRVIKDSGRQITFFESLTRNLLRFVDYLPGFYLTGVITMLCNNRNKRLGDLAAGTLVVHERADEQPLLVQSAAWTPTPADFSSQPAKNARPLETAQREPGRPEPIVRWGQPVTAMFPADAVARLKAHDLVVIEAFFARMLDLPLETRAAMAYRIAGEMALRMGVAPPEGNPERALESIAYQMRSASRSY